jgi:hypothetical protein
MVKKKVKKKIKVYATFPNEHFVHAEVSRTSNAILMDKRYRIVMDYPKERPFVANLHHCVQKFLDNGCDYWLSMDADNPPERNPLDLIKYDKDIIGLPTPIFRPDMMKIHKRPWYFNAYQYNADVDAYHEWPDRKGLQKVDAIGTGCFIIARRVFEHPRMQQAPFMRNWSKEGLTTRGNDIAFCDRARRCKFEIWAHFDYLCNHYKRISLLWMIEAVSEMVGEDLR